MFIKSFYKIRTYDLKAIIFSFLFVTVHVYTSIEFEPLIRINIHLNNHLLLINISKNILVLGSTINHAHIVAKVARRNYYNNIYGANTLIFSF